MATTGTPRLAIAVAATLLALLAGMVLIVRQVGRGIEKSLSCPPGVERLNAACTSLENSKELSIACYSSTGTREWAGCEDRSDLRLSWQHEVDSGPPKRGDALGWIHEAPGLVDAGRWECSDGDLFLALYLRSIPAGDEDDAAIAFGRACAAFEGRPR